MLLLISLVCFSNPDWKQLLNQPEVLEERVVIEDMEHFPNRLVYWADRGLLSFSIRDKVIELFDEETKTWSILAEEGPGPAEMNGGFLHGTLLGDQIVFVEINTSRLKGFRPGDKAFKTLLKDSWRPSSPVLLEENFIVAVIDSPGLGEKTMGAFGHPKMNLTLYQQNVDETWQILGPFYDADIMDYEHADSIYGLHTDLYNTGEPNTFYRLPKWASPVMQVMTAQGEIVRKFKIPHPNADRLSEEPAIKLMKYQASKNQDLVTDASVDSFGHLHILLDSISSEKEDLTNRLIIVINHEGIILASRKIPSVIRYLAVKPNGKSYYGANVDGKLSYFYAAD